jgi:hypothetical protein
VPESLATYAIYWGSFDTDVDMEGLLLQCVEFHATLIRTVCSILWRVLIRAAK